MSTSKYSDVKNIFIDSVDNDNLYRTRYNSYFNSQNIRGEFR